ncbi:hypothetical protein JCM8097_003790 [Rhodosporidiobolus ruineniae]
MIVALSVQVNSVSAAKSDTYLRCPLVAAQRYCSFSFKLHAVADAPACIVTHAVTTHTCSPAHLEAQRRTAEQKTRLQLKKLDKAPANAPAPASTATHEQQFLIDLLRTPTRSGRAPSPQLAKPKVGSAERVDGAENESDQDDNEGAAIQQSDDDESSYEDDHGPSTPIRARNAAPALSQRSKRAAKAPTLFNPLDYASPSKRRRKKQVEVEKPAVELPRTVLVWDEVGEVINETAELELPPLTTRFYTRADLIVYLHAFAAQHGFTFSRQVESSDKSARHYLLLSGAMAPSDTAIRARRTAAKGKCRMEVLAEQEAAQYDGLWGVRSSTITRIADDSSPMAPATDASAAIAAVPTRVPASPTPSFRLIASMSTTPPPISPSGPTNLTPMDASSPAPLIDLFSPTIDRSPRPSPPAPSAANFTPPVPATLKPYFDDFLTSVLSSSDARSIPLVKRVLLGCGLSTLSDLAVFFQTKGPMMLIKEAWEQGVLVAEEESESVLLALREVRGAIAGDR